MNEQNQNNKITLAGTVVTEPQFSHAVQGEDFYEYFVSSDRLSGQDDVLRVTMSGRLGMFPEVGDRVMIDGQVRSYNKFDDSVGRNRLVLTVFARDIRALQPDEPDKNEVTLVGYVCKDPVYRITPFHREISDLLLACNRAYGKSDYLPLIAWGRNARLAREVTQGNELQVMGRLQSREYSKVVEGKEEQRTAYEISVYNLRVAENLRQS